MSLMCRLCSFIQFCKWYPYAVSRYLLMKIIHILEAIVTLYQSTVHMSWVIQIRFGCLIKIRGFLNWQLNLRLLGLSAV